MGLQFRLQAVWNVRLKQKPQTNTTNASLKAVHQRNTQSRELTKVELLKQLEFPDRRDIDGFKDHEPDTLGGDRLEGH